MEIADTIKFRQICSMLSKIKNTNNKEKKTKIIKEYYDSFCKHREAFREEQQWKPEMEEVSRIFICDFVLYLILFIGNLIGRPK